jgi:hypothetical protein
MFVLSLMFVVACGGESAPQAEAPVAAEAPAATASTDVEKAAVIAAAIEKEPARADAILQENGTDRASFEALLYDIAADPG